MALQGRNTISLLVKWLYAFYRRKLKISFQAMVPILYPAGCFLLNTFRAQARATISSVCSRIVFSLTESKLWFQRPVYKAEVEEKKTPWYLIY